MDVPSKGNQGNNLETPFELSDHVRKRLLELPAETQQQLVKDLERVAKFPKEWGYPLHGNWKGQRGYHTRTYKIRWRTILREGEQIVEILNLGPRNPGRANDPLEILYETGVILPDWDQEE